LALSILNLELRSTPRSERLTGVFFISIVIDLTFKRIFIAVFFIGKNSLELTTDHARIKHKGPGPCAYKLWISPFSLIFYTHTVLVSLSATSLLQSYIIYGREPII